MFSLSFFAFILSATLLYIFTSSFLSFYSLFFLFSLTPHLQFYFFFFLVLSFLFFSSSLKHLLYYSLLLFSFLFILSLSLFSCLRFSSSDKHVRKYSDTEVRTHIKRIKALYIESTPGCVQRTSRQAGMDNVPFIRYYYQQILICRT